MRYYVCVTGLSRWGLEIDKEEFDGFYSIDLKLCLHVTHGHMHMHHKQRPLCSSSEIFGVMECICVFVCACSCVYVCVYVSMC